MNTLLLFLSVLTTAFPSAEGFGKFATGGRGGNIYYVTSLQDCTDADLQPGTLRRALRDGDDTPRTILFRVCGTIYLTSDLKFAHPNITIAGQSAPGGGICIAGHKFYVCKNNIIIRHIRFRAGDIPDKSCPSIDVENVHNVILDHCSFTWSMEECLTMYDCDSTTVQWSIIGEGLYNSKNSKGARAYATQWGGEHSTMHHCLITNCNNRTPRFNGVRDESDLAHGKTNHDAQVDSEFANNVVFNWGKQNSLYGGENDTTKNKDACGNPVGYNYVYMLNNYFRPGPCTTKNVSPAAKYRFVGPSSSNGYGSWLLSGNIFSVESPLNTDNYSGWLAPNASLLTAMRDSSGLSLESAEQAFLSVCADAGATLPQLDEVDRRLRDEAAGLIDPVYYGDIDSTGKPDRGLGIINTPYDIVLMHPDTFTVLNDSKQPILCTCYPSLAIPVGEELPDDTDLDGIPDEWETLHGLNPNDPSDGNAATLSALPDYTNLEFYLNGADGETAETLNPWTALHNIRYNHLSALQAYKIMRNGTLYILRNNCTYSTLGQTVTNIAVN